MTSSTSDFLTLRGLNCHLRSWGAPEAPPLLLLHGWMDCSASFQFFAEAFLALAPGWRLLAPDWRGFGMSEWVPDGSYIYADYLADLDALVDKLALPAPATIVGHSMGGWIACMYAAARPGKVARVVNIEGTGMGAREGAEAPAHLARWLDEAKSARMPKSYASFDELAGRIAANNPALTPERAQFVARHWAAQIAPGVVTLLADPGHNARSPQLFRLDEAKALWGAVKCPVLWVEADDSRNAARHGITPEELRERRESLRTARLARVAGAGHMAHLEQPGALARLALDFLESTKSADT